MLDFIFKALTRPSFCDLMAVGEKAYRATCPNTIGYFLVRPVGLDEANRPLSESFVQKAKK